jgi:nucleotide-binding universal stress UspA family protein
MRILIGHDGSDCSAAAIDDLRWAGLPADAEALVLSVADVWVAPPSPELISPRSLVVLREQAEAAVANARRIAAAAADQLAGMFPRWKVRSDARAESPYWALIEKAHEWRADLVVVGSHGRSALGRLILGSVSQNVLSHAGCSVRIGRRRGGRGDAATAADVPADGPVKVLLGTDGSTDADAAVRMLRSREWPSGSEVRVAMGVNLKLLTAASGFGSIRREDDPEGLGWVRRIVDQAADYLRRPGLNVTPVVLDGDPKRVLVAEAERWGADCIFLGAQGYTRLQQFLIGSVSMAVAARAHCSVEVVRRP